MSYNIKVVAPNGITFQAKLDPIKGNPRKVGGKEIKMKDSSPAIRYKDPTGQFDVVYAELDNKTNKVLEAGRSTVFINPQNPSQTFKKDELLTYFETETGELIPAKKNEKTDVFEITDWEPWHNYMDKYAMDNYYQVRPSQGVSKKQLVQLREIELNTQAMKALWDYMMSTDNGIVGRGKLCVTSAGFLPSVGYLRAVQPDFDEWTFEMAVFRETKNFSWSQKLAWQPTSVSHPTNGHATVNAKAGVAEEVDDI